MKKLLVQVALLYSTFLFAQNERPVFIGYELRSSGPNVDQLYFLERNVSTRWNLSGSCRKFDKLWNGQPPIFKIPLKGYSIGLDIEYMVQFNQYQLGFSAGSIAFKARSYSNGGKTKLFISPTTYLNVQTNIFPNLILGIRAGSLWFINTDVYRNFNGVRHEELSLFIKYQISALNAGRGKGNPPIFSR